MKYNFMFLDRFRDSGLLLLRIGIGSMFLLYHGLPKLLAGPPRWEEVGGAMAAVGITFSPAFWGLMAALAESLGAALLALGLFTRYALFFLLITMIVAAASRVGGGVPAAAHPIEMGIVFLSLMFIGPGKYSLDARFR